MSKFAKKGKKKQPGISTAALPDIVFMLLFYFMVAASIKSSNYENFIRITLPKGEDLTKIEAKNLINYIYVGTPTDKYRRYGNQPNVIVADDKIIASNEIKNVANKWIGNVEPSLIKEMRTMLNIDIGAKLGIVQDIEDELGRSNLPRVVYTGNTGNPNDNFQ